MLAERLSALRPSPTLAVNARAAQLKAQGHDIVNLSAGEPDFDTPDFVKAAAVAALGRGETKYTAVDGTPTLKDAVIEKFARENGLHYTRDQVSVGAGGKQIIYNALMATLNPGDEVIIPAPYWVSYPDMTLLAQGTPVIVACDESEGFCLTPKALQKAITNKTRWVIINGPNNPTGGAYSEQALRAIADVLLQHPHVMVLSDDIYEHLIYDGFMFKTIAAVEPKLFERTLTVNGVSKSHAMTGWRIGYAGGPSHLIKAMGTLQSQSTSNPCSIAQAAAVAALTGPQDFLVVWRNEFQTRRDAALGLLNSIPGVSCRKPEGAFYVFPNFQNYIGRKTAHGQVIKDDTELATYLLEQGVAGVPGSAFGAAGYMRFSYATALSDIEKGCARIIHALSQMV